MLQQGQYALIDNQSRPKVWEAEPERYVVGKRGCREEKLQRREIAEKGGWKSDGRKEHL